MDTQDIANALGALEGKLSSIDTNSQYVVGRLDSFMLSYANDRESMSQKIDDHKEKTNEKIARLEAVQSSFKVWIGLVSLSITGLLMQFLKKIL